MKLRGHSSMPREEPPAISSCVSAAALRLATLQHAGAAMIHAANDESVARELLTCIGIASSADTVAMPTIAGFELTAFTTLCSPLEVQLPQGATYLPVRGPTAGWATVLEVQP
jgi:hypothetical protein